jgi:glycosyltransferase involved in cell wall biosynthesis
MEDREYLRSTLGVAEDKITRIYPAADPLYGATAPRRDYTRAQTLVFAGSWINRKGTGDVVQSFASLAVRHPQLRLVVLNGGVPESAVRACFPEPLQARVSCIRAEPEVGTAAVLAAADIYLLPSLFEGTPLTMLEAMWSGMPIISTATCGMADVISNGSTGLLVPIRSPEAIVAAVEQLLADGALRARLGRAAHALACQSYTWPKVAGPVQEVYEQLCQGGHNDIVRRRSSTLSENYDRR